MKCRPSSTPRWTPRNLCSCWTRESRSAQTLCIPLGGQSRSRTANCRWGWLEQTRRDHCLLQSTRCTGNCVARGVCFRSGKLKGTGTPVAGTGAACDLHGFQISGRTGSGRSDHDPIFRFVCCDAGRAGRQIDSFASPLSQILRWRDGPVVLRRIPGRFGGLRLSGGCGVRGRWKRRRKTVRKIWETLPLRITIREVGRKR